MNHSTVIVIQTLNIDLFYQKSSLTPKKFYEDERRELFVGVLVGRVS